MEKKSEMLLNSNLLSHCMNGCHLFFFPALLLLSGCRDEAFPPERHSRFTGYDPVGYAINAPDSAVIGFLKWYRAHEDGLRRIDFIKGGLRDTTTFYHVDFFAVQRYLQELRKSGFLSEEYLSGVVDYIQDCDRGLKKHPQNDGPAFGFEADLVMKAQDYMDVWEELPYAVVISKKINGHRAFLDLAVASSHIMRFELSLVDGSWKIDSLFHNWDADNLRLNYY